VNDRIELETIKQDANGFKQSIKSLRNDLDALTRSKNKIKPHQIYHPVNASISSSHRGRPLPLPRTSRQIAVDLSEYDEDQENTKFLTYSEKVEIKK